MPRAVSLLLVSLVVVLGTTTQAGGVTASSSCGLHICTKSDACAVDSDCPGSSCNCGALRCEFSSCGNDGVRIINNHMLKCICESAWHSVIYHYYDNYIVHTMSYTTFYHLRCELSRTVRYRLPVLSLCSVVFPEFAFVSGQELWLQRRRNLWNNLLANVLAPSATPPSSRTRPSSRRRICPTRSK